MNDHAMIEETRYGLRTSVSVGYEEAIEKTTAALKEQGFGILTTIEIHKALKEKLGVDFRRYTILGACNPSLAHRALNAELELGLLLPCNVVVYEQTDGGSMVAAMAPLPTIGMIGNPDLQDVAREADERLRKALAIVARG